MALMKCAGEIVWHLIKQLDICLMIVFGLVFRTWAENFYQKYHLYLKYFCFLLVSFVAIYLYTKQNVEISYEWMLFSIGLTLFIPVRDILKDEIRKIWLIRNNFFFTLESLPSVRVFCTTFIVYYFFFIWFSPLTIWLAWGYLICNVSRSLMRKQYVLPSTI